jgi:DNA-binding response OmpR family regulator
MKPIREWDSASYGPAGNQMTYTFGELRINTATREVRRGSDVVELEPRSYELLIFFIEHRDKALSKDELQDGSGIWLSVRRRTKRRMPRFQTGVRFSG